MAEGLALSLALTAAEKLIDLLWAVKKTKEHNTTVCHEVDKFVTSVNQNVDQLKKLLPSRATPWAFESLRGYLEETGSYVEKHLKDGFFRSVWDASKIKSELEKLRQNLVNQFLQTLLMTSIQVAAIADKKLDAVRTQMEQMLTVQHSDSSRENIKEFLQPLIVGDREQTQRIHSFIAMARGTEDQLESLEAQKFWLDVVANLELLTSESDHPKPAREEDASRFNDPITHDQMIDPVKCSDGRTYDRWTIIDNNVSRSPFHPGEDRPFAIVCDDVDVREELFAVHTDAETRCRERRHGYREKALALAADEHHAEALVMLHHVLNWSYADRECQQASKRMEDAIARRPKEAPIRRVTLKAPTPTAASRTIDIPQKVIQKHGLFNAVLMHEASQLKWYQSYHNLEYARTKRFADTAFWSAWSCLCSTWVCEPDESCSGSYWCSSKGLMICSPICLFGLPCLLTEVICGRPTKERICE